MIWQDHNFKYGPHLAPGLTKFQKISIFLNSDVTVFQFSLMYGFWPLFPNDVCTTVYLKLIVKHMLLP